ncbi:Integrase, catalytic core [Gossypium australe]|uniref:Integrase, catalytic core n=1 Tax=Gossypium australe TaxID=47621 RepID=A0A5B6WZE2_9ROSI|nr:Integrase, catalytic core [Gossypium australe]
MIVTLMTRLLQKDVKFEWSMKCQQSFDQLKALLTEAPIFVQLESGKEFVIYNDASLNSLDFVLMQEGKVIAYAFRQLKPHEKNYPTYDLELATIIFALKIWRHNLYELKAKLVFLQQICEAQNCDNDLQTKRIQFCQQVKAEHQVPSGLLQPVMIPKWKWDRVTMDFVSGLPLSPKKKYAIWVVVDRLTKSGHFIPVRTDYSLDKLVELYISDIVRLHWIPVSIISDRDLRFTSRFWKKLQEALGMSFIWSQMSNSIVLDELCEKKIHGVDLIRETEEQLKVIRDSLKAASDQQRSYANLKRKDIEFQISDKVFLEVSLWKKILRFGHKGKLSLRFIGPYEIIERIGPVAYRLALPSGLEKVTGVEEVTWESEEAMRKQYPNLFAGKIFGDVNP